MAVNCNPQFPPKVFCQVKTQTDPSSPGEFGLKQFVITSANRNAAQSRWSISMSIKGTCHVWFPSWGQLGIGAIVTAWNVWIWWMLVAIWKLTLRMIAVNPDVFRQGRDERPASKPCVCLCWSQTHRDPSSRLSRSFHPIDMKLSTGQCPTPLIRRHLATLSGLIGIMLQSIKSQNDATTRLIGCLGPGGCGKAVFEV